MAPSRRAGASAALAAVAFLGVVVASLAAPAYPVSVTTSPATPAAKVSLYGGVNSGHSFDISWQMFMKRLGVNAARLFGGSGGISPNRADPLFGTDLSGSPVTSAGLYTAAVQRLRTFDGHEPSSASRWANPIKFDLYEGGLSAVDRTKPSGQSVLNQITTLQSMGIEPLLVQWNTCGSFAFTTYDSSTPMFYMERWELYKHQYTVAMWSWKKGVRKLEFWNEPDLNAPCINFNATQWNDYYIIQAGAINDVYADMNQEYRSNQRPCPQGFLTCPIQPIVLASAFASSTFSGDASPPAGAVYLGGPTLQNEHTTFPGYNQDRNTQNLHAYSLHTYGKTGQQFQATLSNLDQSIAAIHTDTTGRFPVIPVVVTEHMTHTSGQWGQTVPSTGDAPFEASRLAAQMMRALANGYEAYAFKFSTTPSVNGGIAKTGIHWGDVTQFPYIVGDTAMTGEAARLVLKACSGDKYVDTITLAKSTSTQTVPANAFRTSASTRDAARRYFIFINDCAATSGVAADCDTNANPANAADVTLTINLNSWGLPAGTILPVTTVAAGLMGEVNMLATLNAAGQITVPAPSASVVLVTGQASGTQVVSVLPAVDDAVIAPTQPTGNVNSDQLTVSTSNTADHSTTRVSLLKFQVPSTAANGGLTAAILELTLSKAPAQTMILHLFGAACDSAWSENTVSWNSAGAFAVNTSIPVNGVISQLSQNFQYIDTTTTFAGHITVPAGSAVGTVFRVDVADYVQMCPGQSVTISIHRRLRNPLYVGNVVGNIPADDLSGGASVSFYSAESTAGQGPQLRLLLATSLATGVMSASLPGRAASTPAGRRALAADTDSQATVSAALAQALGLPVVVTVASYSLSADLLIQGLTLDRYQQSVGVQTAIQEGIGADISDPESSNVYIKSVQSVNKTGVRVSLMVDGYDSAPDNGYTAVTRDHDQMLVNPAAFFDSLQRSLATALSAPLASIVIDLDRTSTVIMAAHQVVMNTTVGNTGDAESMFSNAVQSGIIQEILRGALGSDVSIKAGDPVQAQRLAVSVALGMATSSSDDALEELQQMCLLQQVQAREWRSVGIAFVISTGVLALVVIGLVAAVAFYFGERSHRHRLQYHTEVMAEEQKAAAEAKLGQQA